MQALSRRAVLKTGLKIGAGLVAFVPVMRSLATDTRAAGSQATQPSPSSAISPPTGISPPPPPPATVTPRHIIQNYAGGNVVTVGENVITLKASPGSSRDTVELHLSASTQIWKGEWNPNAAIEVGDHVDAWGQPEGTNVLDVEKMWVNIVNLMGTISSIKQVQGGLLVQHQDSRTGAHTVIIDQRTIVDSQGSLEITYSNASVALHVGQLLQIIGLRLKDGTIRATRLLF